MTAKSDAETIGLDKLVAIYIKIRDKKANLQRELDEQLAALDAKMDLVKTALLDHCRDCNVESVRTTSGTFYRTVKNRYWTSDWDSMNKFILDNDAVDLLEKRIHQTNMRTFLEENPDKLPPGLNVDSEYTVTVVRRK